MSIFQKIQKLNKNARRAYQLKKIKQFKIQKDTQKAVWLDQK